MQLMKRCCGNCREFGSMLKNSYNDGQCSLDGKIVHYIHKPCESYAASEEFQKARAEYMEFLKEGS